MGTVQAFLSLKKSYRLKLKSDNLLLGTCGRSVVDVVMKQQVIAVDAGGVEPAHCGYYGSITKYVLSPRSNMLRACCCLLFLLPHLRW